MKIIINTSQAYYCKRATGWDNYSITLCLVKDNKLFELNILYSFYSHDSYSNEPEDKEDSWLKVTNESKASFQKHLESIYTLEFVEKNWDIFSERLSYMEENLEEYKTKESILHQIKHLNSLLTMLEDFSINN